jgi:hypothetical protein
MKQQQMQGCQSNLARKFYGTKEDVISPINNLDGVLSNSLNILENYKVKEYGILCFMGREENLKPTWAARTRNSKCNESERCPLDVSCCHKLTTSRKKTVID